VQNRGGSRLFIYYPSLAEALQTIYPSFPWDPSRFRTRKKKITRKFFAEGSSALLGERKKAVGFWKDKANVLDALNRSETQLGIAKVPYC